MGSSLPPGSAITTEQKKTGSIFCTSAGKWREKKDFKMSWNPYNLTVRIALITGPSRGIGRAAGLKLAAFGAKVIFHGVKESEKLRSAVADVVGHVKWPENRRVKWWSRGG